MNAVSTRSAVAVAAKPPSEARIQSLDRAFTFLELLADAGGELSLSEISNRSGVPLPTAHRALRAMAGQGYVRQMQSKRYALGSKLIVLGDVAAKILGACADPYLQQLVDDIGETANLSILDGESVAYIAVAPSRHTMRHVVEVGQRAPIHCTAEGKAILATLPPSQVKSIAGHVGLERRTGNSIGDLKQLQVELGRVREQGFALDNAESELGLRGVAVSVPYAPTPMSVSISGPEGRLPDECLPVVVEALQAAAERILDCA